MKTKDDLFSSRKYDTHNGFRMRSLMADEQYRLVKDREDMDDLDFICRLVGMMLCDEFGEPLLSNGEHEQLKTGMSLGELEDLATACVEHAGLSPDRDPVKN